MTSLSPAFRGLPSEVIFAQGKTPEQVVAIAERLLANAPNVLITRARAEVHRIAHGLSGLGGPWAGMQVVASAVLEGLSEDAKRSRMERSQPLTLAKIREFFGIERVVAGLRGTSS